MGFADDFAANLRYREKNRARQEARKAEKKAKNLPKVFDFYCPHCLFQTNEFTKICPECRSHRLERTQKKGNRKKKELK
jgi:rubredoxin